MQLTLPSISYVVARSLPGYVIGNENRLSLAIANGFIGGSKKLQFGQSIIMGRKTHLSIGRALPGRINIVLSRSADHNVENDFWQRAETAVVWAGNLESALYFADVISVARGLPDVFIIGGAEMYAIFHKLFNKIYLTEVLTGKRLAGDATFRFPIDKRQWSTLTDQDVPAGLWDEYPSRFRILERRRKWVRYVEINEFYTGSNAESGG